MSGQVATIDGTVGKDGNGESACVKLDRHHHALLVRCNLAHALAVLVYSVQLVLVLWQSFRDRAAVLESGCQK